MDKVLIVTGASRGIGAAIARMGADQGWSVVVHYGSATAEALAVVADITRSGGKAAAFQAEISDPKAVGDLFAFADRTFGPVTGLVNNAGIIGGQCPILDLTPGLIERVLAVNVAGAYYALAEAARRMAKSRGGAGGAIVNISSIAATLGGLPKEVHYAASKGAVDSMTIGAAVELVKEGIRVNGVRPGIVETDIHDAHGGREFIARFAPNIPIGRAGKPEEIASVVLWLLSDAAAYVTGALYNVTGGR